MKSKLYLSIDEPHGNVSCGVDELVKRVCGKPWEVWISYRLSLSCLGHCMADGGSSNW